MGDLEEGQILEHEDNEFANRNKTAITSFQSNESDKDTIESASEEGVNSSPINMVTLDSSASTSPSDKYLLSNLESTYSPITLGTRSKKGKKNGSKK